MKAAAAPRQVNQRPRCTVSDHRRPRGGRAGSGLRMVSPALAREWAWAWAWGSCWGRPGLELGSRIQNPQILARQPERQVKSLSLFPPSPCFPDHKKLPSMQERRDFYQFSK